ncbi:MAG: zinc-binding dehydrogenase [Armatimonadetes bacterium]|nr:zinc-binding dehydrogenase [Armatimonadota bacterium]
MKQGDRYGLHRVIEPEGAFPQWCWKLDNTVEIADNEILVDVDALNIDSASFTQIREETGGDPEKMAARMLEIVTMRGKHHNPVTGSGGILTGIIEQIGPRSPWVEAVHSGDRVLSLVSLSLTPLRIDRILGVDPRSEQVPIQGKAVLFASSIFSLLPEDMTSGLAMAVLDVCGAPAQTARLVRSGDTVIVIGAGGKSGLLCLHEARKRVSVTGKVIALIHSERSRSIIEEAGLADLVVPTDATKPAKVLALVEEITNGRLADVVINCVNVKGTEMASILAARQGGTVYFFGMATSFTAAALGAEGVAKDVTLVIGNGYVPGHDRIALQAIRENSHLRTYFEEQFVRKGA